MGQCLPLKDRENKEEEEEEKKMPRVDCRLVYTQRWLPVNIPFNIN